MLKANNLRKNKNTMKKIIVEYYSRKNLGDDLFVQVLSEQFADCKILLLGNPLMYTKHFNKNIKMHFGSYILMILGKASCFFPGSKIERFLINICRIIKDKIKSKGHASVKIGGSIFMSHSEQEELDFSTQVSPSYEIVSNLNEKNSSFVIGANLGPVYSEKYWEQIEKEFSEYKHITLRDYSSYMKMSHLKNVQYAPDVVFGVKVPTSTVSNGVVISVVDISIHTRDADIVDSYYKRLTELIDHFNERNIPVTLISFCRKEGDEKAIKKLLKMTKKPDKIKTKYYDGDFEEIIELFSNASYIVGTRFHSIILGIHCKKPVLPIMYSCKTYNYLLDLGFEGTKLSLADLKEQTIETLLANYDANYVCDCKDHERYSSNQFWALRKYIDSLF